MAGPVQRAPECAEKEGVTEHGRMRSSGLTVSAAVTGAELAEAWRPGSVWRRVTSSHQECE